MRSISMKWITAVAIVIAAAKVNGQFSNSIITIDPVTTTTTAASIIPPVNTATTTVPPVVVTTTTTTTTTLSTLSPVTVVPVINSSVIVSTPSSTVPVTLAPITFLSTSPASSSAASSASSSLPSASPSVKPETEKSSSTPIIVGAVVGGIVLIALIGGIIAFINRRGGCAKRTTKNKADFEDYGVGDFPHHRPVSAGAPIPIEKNSHIAPSIPRLNDQGNYYADDGYGAHYGGSNVSYGVNNVDYGVNNVDYGVQQQGYYIPEQQSQQGYYYPEQPQQPQQQYYDDGYYYDNSGSQATYVKSPAMPQQYTPNIAPANIVQGQQPYIQNTGIPPQQGYLKPDDIGSPHK